MTTCFIVNQLLSNLPECTRILIFRKTSLFQQFQKISFLLLFLDPPRLLWLMHLRKVFHKQSLLISEHLFMSFLRNFSLSFMIKRSVWNRHSLIIENMIHCITFISYLTQMSSCLPLKYHMAWQNFIQIM